MTTVCYNQSSSSNTSGCRLCKKNYTGVTFDAINSAGSATCLKAQVIHNCETHMQISASVTQCYACKSDYAVDNT